MVKIGDIVSESESATVIELFYKVERLFCDIKKKKAMVEIVRLNNTDVSIKLPALLIKLRDNSNDVSIVVIFIV